MPNARPDDYVLQLTCSNGIVKHSSTVKVVLFPEHRYRETRVLHSPAEPPPPRPPDGPPAVKPLGLWPFDGTAEDSTKAYNGATFSLHPSLSAMEPDFSAEGRFGKGIQLTCDKESCVQLEFGNFEVPEMPFSALSVSFWFKPRKTHKFTMLRKGSLKVSIGDSGEHSSSGGGPDAKIPGITAGSWHHYAIAFDQSIKKAYLDGRLVLMESGNTRNAADVVDKLTFGIRSDDDPSYGFDGVLDDFAVFSFVLSNDEVDKLRSQSASKFIKRLGGNPYWKGDHNTSFVTHYFPSSPTLPGNNDASSRTRKSGGQSPDPYVHPRIFFDASELPSVQARLYFSNAGWVAMENVRSLVRESFPYDTLELTNWTYQQLHDAEFKYQGWIVQVFILNAFRCLIDGDRATAERLGQQLDSLADEQLERLRMYRHDAWKAGQTTYDATDTWQSHHSTVVFHVMTAFCYDFIYPYLLESTRAKLRSVLTIATTGTWAIGMDALEAYPALTSNWLPWILGDLALNLIAIEGENNFDEGVYKRAARAFHGWTSLGVSAESGAPFDGGGKWALGGPKLLALALHGYPQYATMPGVNQYATKFLFHTMLPNGDFFREGLEGGCQQKPDVADVVALKYALPGEATVDWVYRNVVQGERGMPYRAFAPPKMAIWSSNNFLTAIIYASDFSGPSDWAQHGLQASAKEPLTYVAKDHGLVITRSAWADRDAAWVAFVIRSLPGIHKSPSRGTFVFYALGEVWSFYNTGQNEHSDMHSVVLVDGQGQGKAPGRFESFLDSAEATVATADLRHAYGGNHFGNETVNSYMLERGSLPWQELAWGDLPHWYRGVPGVVDGATGLLPSSPSSFRKASRTLGFVRSAPQPYAIILDHFQKDADVRNYSWRMALKPSVDRASPLISGNDIILSAGDGRSRLLVRLLGGSTETTSIGLNTSNYLEITSRGVEARFHVLLWPLKGDADLPSTTWVREEKVLTVAGPGGQPDMFKLEEADAGTTKVMGMTRAGKIVVFQDRPFGPAA